jgi:phosphohistidine phosphatase
MGKRLFKAGVKINAFVSSPAKRARKTCKAFIEAYDRDKDEIILKDKLYNAPSSVYYEVVKELDKTYESVAMFGHNPGITQFVQSLCPGAHIESMPTCGVFAVEADVKNWEDFEPAERRFLFFKFPKES